MVKEAKKINFHTVAEAAGVSVAYLYKHDSIKQRIDQLRKQQSLSRADTKAEYIRRFQAIITVLKKRISDHRSREQR